MFIGEEIRRLSINLDYLITVNKLLKDGNEHQDAIEAMVKTQIFDMTKQKRGGSLWLDTTMLPIQKIQEELRAHMSFKKETDAKDC
jgi:hypothetical protein